MCPVWLCTVLLCQGLRWGGSHNLPIHVSRRKQTWRLLVCLPVWIAVVLWWGSDQMYMMVHCNCMWRDEHCTCQERLSGVASPTNPAGYNQLMRISSRENCQGNGRCPEFTGLLYGWEGLAVWTLQETISLLPEIFKDWKAVILFWPPYTFLHFQVFEHLMRLSCTVRPVPYREKIVHDGLLPDSYKLGVWENTIIVLDADRGRGGWGGGVKCKDTKMGGGKNENILTAVLLKPCQKWCESWRKFNLQQFS